MFGPFTTIVSPPSSTEEGTMPGKTRKKAKRVPARPQDLSSDDNSIKEQVNVDSLRRGSATFWIQKTTIWRFTSPRWNQDEMLSMQQYQ
jgi:hypothetical protein